MASSSAVVRVLLVEDYQPFRVFVRSLLGDVTKWLIVGEAADGLQAVCKAKELQPDLIVLDIGLPGVNGIEAARRIRKLSPESKIVFVSQESAAEVVQEALALGAFGFLGKAQAGTELLAAVESALEGSPYIGMGLSGRFSDATQSQACQFPKPAGSPIPGTQKKGIVHNHEVQFYSHDASFLASLVLFAQASLREGNAVIVVATESHRNGLLQGLHACGVDTAAACEQERLILLDASDVLSAFAENGGPSRERFISVIAPLISRAEAKHKGVVIFGEMVALLCARGNVNAAIELEQWWNELAQTHSFRLRCAYPMGEGLKGLPHAAICAEHSAVISAEF